MLGASVKWPCLQQHLTRRLHKEAGCLCFVLDVGASVGHMLAESIDQVGSSSALTYLPSFSCFQWQCGEAGCMCVCGPLLWCSCRSHHSKLTGCCRMERPSASQSNSTTSGRPAIKLRLCQRHQRGWQPPRACKRYTRPSRKTLQRVSRSSLYDPG